MGLKKKYTNMWSKLAFCSCKLRKITTNSGAQCPSWKQHSSRGGIENKVNKICKLSEKLYTVSTQYVSILLFNALTINF